MRCDGGAEARRFNRLLIDAGLIKDSRRVCMPQLHAVSVAIGAHGAKAGRAPQAPLPLADVTVAFRLGQGGTYTAVERVSLAVADGEFVAIVGPTGCGKSTLLNVAAGLIAPSAGTIDIFGTPLAGLNRQAGYCSRPKRCFRGRRRCENVAIGLETAGVARREARARATHGLRASALAVSATVIRTCSRAGRGSASVSPRC